MIPLAQETLIQIASVLWQSQNIMGSLSKKPPAQSSFLTATPDASCRNFSTMFPKYVCPAFRWLTQNMSLFQKVVHSIVRLPRCMDNLPFFSLHSLVWTLLGTQRTSLRASPLEHPRVAETLSMLNPPTVCLHAPMVLFCPI